MLKSILVAVSAVAMMTSSAALAADFIEPVVSSNMYAPEPVATWTGPYVGVNAGMGGGTFEHPLSYSVDEDELLDGSLDITANGFVGGVQAGYNWELGNNLVFGIEGDIQASSVDGRLTLSGTDDAGVIGDPGDTLDANAGTKLDWFATIRPRIGLAMGNFMVYGTAGFAFGHSTSSAELSAGGTDFGDISEDADRTGWTAGAGVEVALTDHITAKAEYLYTDLGTETVFDGPLGLEDGDEGSLESTIKFSTIRAGVNFHF